MKHSDFQINLEFNCDGKLWRCTDVGSRIVVAICLSDHLDDPTWFNGPPYSVSEEVFDEDDIVVCTLPQAPDGPP